MEGNPPGALKRFLPPVADAAVTAGAIPSGRPLALVGIRDDAAERAGVEAAGGRLALVQIDGRRGADGEAVVAAQLDHRAATGQARQKS